MTQEPQRRRRIEAEIQRVLSEVIAREVKDPRVGSVTITGVRMAPDMGGARVYFMPFASLSEPEEVRAGLTHAGGFLRGEVGRRLRLRHAPRLEFVFDDTADRAAHLTGLIDNAVKHDQAVHTEDPGVEGAGQNPGSRDDAANDECV